MTETPWAVVCRHHGQVFLTEAQYDAQMMKPDSKWRCPICGDVSEWDDHNHDRFYEDDDYEDEDD